MSAQAALCAALGYFIDRRWETAPWGTVVGALTCAAAFGVGLAATAKRLERENATLSEEAQALRGREKAELDAVISVESLKTEALRGELEKTLARATALATGKTAQTANSDGADNCVEANETERLR